MLLQALLTPHDESIPDLDHTGEDHPSFDLPGVTAPHWTPAVIVAEDDDEDFEDDDDFEWDDEEDELEEGEEEFGESELEEFDDDDEDLLDDDDEDEL